ncbi:MAG: 6-bladed beta-propeller [Balneolaceae bacterium]
MKRSWFITSVFIALFFLILTFILTRSKRATDLEKAFLQQPVPQSVEDRIWKEMEFEKIGISTEFISSLHMRFGQGRHIYVADNNEKVVKQFDLKGELIHSFGKGEGKGPGEFLVIIDIMIDQAGNLWALDGRNNRVTIFNTEKEEDWKILNFPEVFIRVIPVGSEGYWLERRFDNQMKKHMLSGEYVNDAEAIVDAPSLWSFVLESYSALAPDGSVVQSQFHTNMFLKFSQKGKLLYFRKPIDHKGLPDIEPYYANEVGHMNTVNFSSWEQTTQNPQVVNNTIQLFVHQKIKNSDEWHAGFIDVYNLEDGNYLYSYELPERLEAVTRSGNHLAGISEELGKIMIWKLN